MSEFQHAWAAPAVELPTFEQQQTEATTAWLELKALANTANREHELAVQSGEAMVRHAILAGEALLKAKDGCGDGEWLPWLDENFSGCRSTALNYMRVAVHKDKVQGKASMRQALSAIHGVPAFTPGRRPVYSEDVIAEARALHEEGEGINAIGREFGVSNDTVLKWVDPGYRERRNHIQREHAKRRREAEAKAREKREKARLKRIAREKGGGIAEAYSLACRMEDELGRAFREAEKPEAKAALDSATAHFHKMRDEIVRALGVS